MEILKKKRILSCISLDLRSFTCWACFDISIFFHFFLDVGIRKALKT